MLIPGTEMRIRGSILAKSGWLHGDHVAGERTCRHKKKNSPDCSEELAQSLQSSAKSWPVGQRAEKRRSTYRRAPASAVRLSRSTTVIRFPCPVCNKMLKVPDNMAGKPVICPRCHEPSVAPPASVAYSGSSEESSSLVEPQRRPRSQMSGWLRAGIVAVAGLGGVCLLLAILAPLLSHSEDTVSTIRSEARFIVPACLVLTLVLLYAHGTTCPACGKWWARMEGATTSLHREVLEEGRVRRMRATREMTYICKYCRHTWSATYTDEYEAARRPKRKKRSEPRQ